MSIIKRVKETLKDCVIQQFCEMSIKKEMVIVACKTSSNKIEYWQIITVSKEKDRFDKVSKEIREKLELISESNIVKPQSFFFSKWQEHEENGLDLYMQVESMNSLEFIQNQRTLEEKEIIKMGVDITKALMGFEEMRIDFVGVSPASIFHTKEGNWKLEEANFYKPKQAFVETFYTAPEEKDGIHTLNSDVYRLGKILQQLLKEKTTSDFLIKVVRIACREEIGSYNISIFNHFLTICYEICEIAEEQKKEMIQNGLDEYDILEQKINEQKESILKYEIEIEQNNSKQDETRKQIEDKRKYIEILVNQLKQSMNLLNLETERKQAFEKELKKVNEANESLKKKILKLQAEGSKKDEQISKIEETLKKEKAEANAKIISDSKKKAEEYYNKENYEEALKMYTNVGNLGDSIAQNWLGYMYETGKGTTRNYIEAEKWYRKSAEQGYYLAQSNLGLMYEYAKGVAKDYTEAVKWYRKSAEQGYARAQFSLGYMYDRGYGVTQNYTEAAKWYTKAAEKGNQTAQNNLGLLYRYGRGVKQNDVEAVKWYRKSADQGYYYAQNNLAYMYEMGYGVTKDYIEAARLYEKSANQGYYLAQNNLALMYRYGRGVKQNDVEAVKWHRKSADQGYNVAQNSLGVMYQNGTGVTQSYAEAAKWYRKSAEQGNQYAQSNLGYLYYYGYGVVKDYREAAKWYKKSADQGNVTAKQMIEKPELKRWAI